MNRRLTPQEYDTLPWMHVHGQLDAHEDVHILGTKEALIALRDAINVALADKNGEAQSAEIYCGDGEGLWDRNSPSAA